MKKTRQKKINEADKEAMTNAILKNSVDYFSRTYFDETKKIRETIKDYMTDFKTALFLSSLLFLIGIAGTYLTFKISGDGVFSLFMGLVIYTLTILFVIKTYRTIMEDWLD